MPGTCINPDCPVATTQKCLLSHVLTECPSYRANGAAVPPVAPVQPETAVPHKPANLELTALRSWGRIFHAGIELGTTDAAEILRTRYGHVIAVLGSTDAGKTCFLCSLYLMATNGDLPPGYVFAGSRSLQAFEDRARGLRKWKDGKLPEQMVDHTQLDDPRKPSLLHLCLRETGEERKRIDLLLTDLPGEWTDNLVKRASAAQSFTFMPRADGVVLVVDGKMLLADASRHTVTQEMSYFVDRLANVVKVNKEVPVVLLVSKADEIDSVIPAAAQDLAKESEGHGYRVTIISSAALSRSPEKVRNGTGVIEAIEAIIHNQPRAARELRIPSHISERSFRRFRG